jgi:hypothetical protein
MILWLEEGQEGLMIEKAPSSAVEPQTERGSGSLKVERARIEKADV